MVFYNNSTWANNKRTLLATEDNPWISERSTDIETSEWIDTVRHITPKQWHTNYRMTTSDIDMWSHSQWANQWTKYYNPNLFPTWWAVVIRMTTDDGASKSCGGWFQISPDWISYSTVISMWNLNWKPIFFTWFVPAWYYWRVYLYTSWNGWESASYTAHQVVETI